MTKELSLSDYGRLIKDGVVNVLCPEEAGSSKLSYVFLFTRVLIVCKLAAVSTIFCLIQNLDFLVLIILFKGCGKDARG